MELGGRCSRPLVRGLFGGRGKRRTRVAGNSAAAGGKTADREEGVADKAMLDERAESAIAMISISIAQYGARVHHIVFPSPLFFNYMTWFYFDSHFMFLKSFVRNGCSCDAHALV